ncbi:tryptophan permease [Stemphylium lycopersici]|uniref:Tryptophan permease n=1 Tax=Stemphylium lycopersici TaxID=183478 RepID=A0A364MSB0_STELY|nr:tryptophan permease [Stemphylium lycopersici]
MNQPAIYTRSELFPFRIRLRADETTQIDDLILSHLLCFDLLRARQVDEDWKQAIDARDNLHEKLFLLPKSLRNASSIDQSDYIDGLWKKVDDERLKDDPDTAVWNAIRLNPLLEERKGNVVDSGAHGVNPFDCLSPTVPNMMAAENDDTRPLLNSMFLTWPPIPCVKLFGQWQKDEHTSAHPPISPTFMSDTGMTIGQLAEYMGPTADEEWTPHALLWTEDAWRRSMTMAVMDPEKVSHDVETAPDSLGRTPSHVINEDRLRRSLSARQVQMIAIGGTIGTGLFLGTGKALATGGPASLLICYSIVGFIVFCTMLSLGEMAAFVPVAGSFCTFAGRYVDDAFGFALTWNYWFNDAVSTAADLVALQLLIQYWSDNVPWYAVGIAVWVLIVLANIINVKAYGELEYWLSLLKVVTIVIFIILSIAVNAGGNVGYGYIGGKFWTIGDAPFVGGIGGFASVFVTASFAYGGTESIAITAGETRDPARILPKVVKNVFWRILLFYILTAIMIGFNIPYNYPGLSTKDSRTSPFTIAFQMAGSKAAGSFVNAVVLTSVISAGNHALYAGSRLLYTLGTNGHAPKVFTKLTRYQVPWVSVMTTSLVSIVLFSLSFAGSGQVWTWLQNIVGVSNQLSWICIGISSLRFRAGLKAQGKEHLLPFRNWMYPWGPWVCIILNSFIVLVQGWSCFSPAFAPVSFVSFYLELPIFLVMIVGWKLLKKTKFRRASEMDLETDVYTKDDMEPEERGWKGKSKRIGTWLCF